MHVKSTAIASNSAMICLRDLLRLMMETFRGYHAVDGLIEDGWRVVSAPEKRKAGAAGLDDDSDPFVTKNYPKK